jgi:hypothetical protein
MTQEALPALSNQNDEEAARDEKGPEIFILSLSQDTRLYEEHCAVLDGPLTYRFGF